MEGRREHRKLPRGGRVFVFIHQVKYWVLSLNLEPHTFPFWKYFWYYYFIRILSPSFPLVFTIPMSLLWLTLACLFIPVSKFLGFFVQFYERFPQLYLSTLLMIFLTSLILKIFQ